MNPNAIPIAIKVNHATKPSLGASGFFLGRGPKSFIAFISNSHLNLHSKYSRFEKKSQGILKTFLCEYSHSRNVALPYFTVLLSGTGDVVTTAIGLEYRNSGTNGNGLPAGEVLDNTLIR